MQLVSLAEITPEGESSGLDIAGFEPLEDEVLVCWSDGRVTAHPRQAGGLERSIVPPLEHPVLAASFFDDLALARSVAQNGEARIEVRRLDGGADGPSVVPGCLGGPGDFVLVAEGRYLCGRSSDHSIGYWRVEDGALLFGDCSPSSLHLFFGAAPDGSRVVVGDQHPFDWEAYGETLIEIWVRTGSNMDRAAAEALLDETFPPPRDSATRLRVHTLDAAGVPTERAEIQLYHRMTCDPIPRSGCDTVHVTLTEFSMPLSGIHGSLGGSSGYGAGGGALLQGQASWILTAAGPWNSNLVAGVTATGRMILYSSSRRLTELDLAERPAALRWSKGGHTLAVLAGDRGRLRVFSPEPLEPYLWQPMEP